MRTRSCRGPCGPGRIVLLAVALSCLLWPGEGSAQRDQDDHSVHVVRRGDTLGEIAARHGTDVRTLRAINGMRGSRILVGQRLRVPGDDPDRYLVRRGDTLGEIARRTGVSLGLLRQINEVPGDRIYVGQRLRLRPAPSDAPVHVVRRGDTLTSIARRAGVDVATLRELNGLRGDRIFVGQSLRVREARRSVHIVERGDALWEIARAYGVGVSELRAWNGLQSDRIHPGQELIVHGGTQPRTGTYVVRRGDSLAEIAQLHQMSLSELRRMNGLRGSIIHPGQRLSVRPILGDDDAGLGLLAPHEIDWDSLLPASTVAARYEMANGPYFHQKPRSVAQRSARHIEEPRQGPWQTYRQARELWRQFEQRVEAAGRLSRALEGWTIVLDPGHGGVDPGTIVETETGKGESVYVVEDEYVYDVALRMYVLLRMHGADVQLTLLSPNHLLRSNEPPVATFVHERNEVFNSESINRRNRASSWPRGGRTGLNRRCEITRGFVRGAADDRNLFLSLHADNSPRSKDAMSVFYQETSRDIDREARHFAYALLPALGADATAHGKNLGVLRNNPADIAVLVEVRNLAYASQAWMLRYEKQRQRDAEKIVKGVLDWAQASSGRGPVVSNSSR